MGKNSKTTKTPESKAKPDLVLELEENAQDSLEHGIEHFLSSSAAHPRKTDLKFALLHVFQAVELYLKARLAREHPSLICVEPAEWAREDPRTVAFAGLTARLTAVGVEISTQDLSVLDEVRRLRNRLEHHRVELTVADAKDLVGKTLRFLEEFLRVELDVELEEEVPDNLYEAMSDAIHTWEERVAKAESAIADAIPDGKDAGDYVILFCPECSGETVPVPNPKDDDVRCYLCRNRFTPTDCFRCGQPHLGRGSTCEACEEHIFGDPHGGF